MTRIVGNPPPPGAIVRAKMFDELRSFPLTDTGNAEAFRRLYGGHHLRYNHSRKRWMVWNGLHWVSDTDGEAERAAIDTARWRATAIWLGWSTAEDKEDQRKIVEDSREALEGESVRGINATLDVAKNLHNIATVAADYDRDPFLLTVGNGTLDLQNGELKPADPEDLITHGPPIEYDPSAKCARWHKFLDEIFSGDSDLIDFIQRAVGYSLTGNTREQCLFILHGNGANGKSTFLETVRRLLGSHATTTPFATFMVQHNVGAPRNDLAALVGARLVITSEAGEGAGFDEAVVKQITGQDTISCRFLYGEFFQYIPQLKLWISSNFRPAIRGSDDAIWRRIRLIPFNQQFKRNKRDTELAEKLKAELPGILAWAVQGCLDWQRNGLGRPNTVLEATKEYRRESDQVGRFLSERCISGKEHSVSGNALYSAYMQFWQEQGEKYLANNIFAAQIAKRSFEKKRTRGGFVYQGLGLQSKSG
jgi:putative DNA primase/helicase